MHPIFVLIGESGSGKTTIAKMLEQYYGANMVYTHTTRELRQDDDKISSPIEDFFIEKELNTAVAFTEYDGNYYWTSINDIDFSYEYSVVILDKNGTEDIKKANIGRIIVIKISAEENLRISRMVAQKRDPDFIIKRIDNDKIVFSDIEYDYCVPNIGPADLTAKKIYQIIKKEIEK